MSLDPEGDCRYTEDSLPFELPSLPGPRPESRAQWLQREILPHEHSVRRMIQRTYPTLDAEEIIQGAYLRLMAAGQVYHIKGGRYYLFQTARSEILDRARRNQVAKSAGLEPADIYELDYSADEPSAEEIIDSRRALACFYAALDELPPRLKAVVQLRRIEGLCVNATAERLAISVSSIEKMQLRAMRQLSAAMAAHGLSWSQPENSVRLCR